MHYRFKMILSAAAIMFPLVSSMPARSQQAIQPRVLLPAQCDAALANCIVMQIACDQARYGRCVQSCNSLSGSWYEGDPRRQCKLNCLHQAGCSVN